MQCNLDITKGKGTGKISSSLSRLSVRQRIAFKILLYTFKALHWPTPKYLTELISPYVHRRALRSADQLLLEQPMHKLKLIGLRAFSVCLPDLWNSLPFEIKSSASFSTNISLDFQFFLGGGGGDFLDF